MSTNRQDRKEYYKEYDSVNKEKKAAYRRTRIEKKSEYDKQYFLENKDILRGRVYLKKYGITLEVYTAMYNNQKGVCAICTLPEKSMDSLTGQIRYLSVDHCHTTGVVRGLLCSLCNSAIGKLKDDPRLLRKAALYLEENKG
jgi:Recombination endonuclease VII